MECRELLRSFARLGVVGLWCLAIVGSFVFFKAYSCDWPRPRNLSELGVLYSQQAYRVSGRVMIADYDGIRSVYPRLSKLSNDEIDQVILENALLISELQLELMGIRTTHFDAKPASRWLHYERGQLRAGTIELVYKGEEVGLINLKGSGMSIEANDRVQKQRLLRILLEADPREYTEEHIEAFKAKIELVRKDLAAKKEELDLRRAEGDLPANIRLIEHQIRDQERYLMIQDQLLDYFVRRRSGEDVAAPDLLSLYRDLDYSSGVFALDRALREFISQKATQMVFDQLNERDGSQLQTVRNLFVVGLDIYTLDQKGHKRQVGILGREVTYRDTQANLPTRIPEDLVDSYLGGVQVDDLGAVVDFENILLGDKRVVKFLGHRDSGDSRIAQLARNATRSWAKGRSRAPARLLNRVLRRLKTPLPLTTPSALPDPDLDLALQFLKPTLAPNLPEISDYPDLLVQIVSSYVIIRGRHDPNYLRDLLMNRLPEMGEDAVDIFLPGIASLGHHPAAFHEVMGEIGRLYPDEEERIRELFLEEYDRFAKPDSPSVPLPLRIRIHCYGALETPSSSG